MNYRQNRYFFITGAMVCLLTVLSLFSELHTADAAGTGGKMRVAVIRFEEKGAVGIRDAGEMLAEQLITSMVKTGRFELVEREQLRKILNEQGLGMTGVVARETAVEIGRVYGVEAIVTGSVLKWANLIQVNARLIDTRDGSILQIGKVEAVDANDIPRQMDSLAVQLIGMPAAGDRTAAGYGQGIIVRPSYGTVPDATQLAWTKKTVYAAHEEIVVEYDGLPGNEQDWISVTQQGLPDNQYGEWFYTGGAAQGTKTFSGLEPGVYEVRVYFDWAHTRSYEVQSRYTFRVR